MCVYVFVAFRLRQHIGIKGQPPTEMTMNYLNDFYWRTAPTMSDRCDVTGGLAEIGSAKVRLWEFPLLRKIFPSRYL